MSRMKYLSDYPIYDMHYFDVDPRANTIYLMGSEDYAGVDGGEPGVEFSMANRLIRNINILSQKGDDPILIHMKTCGGYWEEGMAIYDAIKFCPNYVTILAYSAARSMSSIIFQAADRRVLMPNAGFMFHDGTMAMDGTYKQFMNEAGELKKGREVMLNIYIEQLQKQGRFKGEKHSKIRKWLISQMDRREEVYLTSAEAAEIGFADYVFDGDWKKLTKFS